MKLSTSEGWNQTKNDWRLFLENPANICLAAEQNAQVVGTTTAMVYSGKFAWIAMVLVHKEYRQRGISTALLTNTLERLEFCPAVKLDATPAGQHVYKKLGFRDEYLIARMTTDSLNEVPQNFADVKPERIQMSKASEVVRLDETVFGANRVQLIEYLLQQYGEKAWKLTRNEIISGIVLGRTGNRFHHVGPVLAQETEDAKILIGRALTDLHQQPVVVDVLCDKHELVDWLNSLGFKEQRRFVRMYRNHNPFPGEINKQYLICGPEFG